jgi:hypothetical protein
MHFCSNWEYLFFVIIIVCDVFVYLCIVCGFFNFLVFNSLVGNNNIIKQNMFTFLEK